MPPPRYPSDLSDGEWEVIELHLPLPEATGRPRLHPLREILDAVFYVVRGGCSWQLMPHDFPPWKTVYHYFRLPPVSQAGHTAVRTGPGLPPTNASTLPLS